MVESKEKRVRDRVGALRLHLDGFDTTSLLKLRKMMYDRWCWDTGTKDDHEIMKEAEAKLEERGIKSPFMTEEEEAACGVNFDTEGVNQRDLVIHAKSVIVEDPDTKVRETLYDGLNLGSGIATNILEQILEELHHDTTWLYDSNGSQNNYFRKLFRDRLETLLGESFVKATEVISDSQNDLLRQLDNPMIVDRIQTIINDHLAENSTDVAA